MLSQKEVATSKWPQLTDVLEKWLKPRIGELSPLAAETAVEIDAVFNPQDLLARLMGDKELACKVLAGFLEDAPRQLLALRKMLEMGDAEGAAEDFARVEELRGAEEDEEEDDAGEVEA